MQYPTDFFSEYETQPTSEAMVNPAKKDGGTDWKWVIPTALGAAILIGGFLWAAHSEISRIDDRLLTLDKHISRVETAVRIIGAKQGGDTKTLIDEALTVAKNSAEAGHADNAKAIIAYANRLLEEQKQSKADAPAQFFETALTNYQALRHSPELSESARVGTLTLAEYKSVLTPKLSSGVIVHIGEMHKVGTFTYLKDAYLPDNGLHNSPQGTDIDNFILDNVTFENSIIVYRGGPLILKNVRFINCRFLVPDSPKGDQLLAAAIQQPANAQIG